VRPGFRIDDNDIEIRRYPWVKHFITPLLLNVEIVLLLGQTTFFILYPATDMARGHLSNFGFRSYAHYLPVKNNRSNL